MFACEQPRIQYSATYLRDMQPEDGDPWIRLGLGCDVPGERAAFVTLLNLSDTTVDVTFRASDGVSVAVDDGFPSPVAPAGQVALRVHATDDVEDDAFLAIYADPHRLLMTRWKRSFILFMGGSKDDDGDGATDCPPGGGDDCDDENASVYPGILEMEDGLDNDCDGLIDEE